MALSWLDAVEGRLDPVLPDLGIGVLLMAEEEADPGVEAFEGFTAIMVSAVVESLLFPSM